MEKDSDYAASRTILTSKMNQENDEKWGKDGDKGIKMKSRWKERLREGERHECQPETDIWRARWAEGRNKKKTNML